MQEQNLENRMRQQNNLRRSEFEH